MEAETIRSSDSIVVAANSKNKRYSLLSSKITISFGILYIIFTIVGYFWRSNLSFTLISGFGGLIFVGLGSFQYSQLLVSNELYLICILTPLVVSLCISIVILSLYGVADEFIPYGMVGLVAMLSIFIYLAILFKIYQVGRANGNVSGFTFKRTKRRSQVRSVLRSQTSDDVDYDDNEFDEATLTFLSSGSTSSSSSSHPSRRRRTWRDYVFR